MIIIRGGQGGLLTFFPWKGSGGGLLEEGGLFERGLNRGFMVVIKVALFTFFVEHLPCFGCKSWQIAFPSLPPSFFWILGYGLLGIFQWYPLQCDSASWWLLAGVVSVHTVAMVTSLLHRNRLDSQATNKAPVPKLSNVFGNEFKWRVHIKYTVGGHKEVY